jgi:lariat debranching enzyme
MGLLQTIKPIWWFSAHLHVRYEATIVHESRQTEKIENPDEIRIDDDLDVVGSTATANPEPSTSTAPPPPRQNPDEIALDDEEFAVETHPPAPPPLASSQSQPQGPITRFLALDKCLPKRQFLEVRHLPAKSVIYSPLNPSFTPGR